MVDYIFDEKKVASELDCAFWCLSKGDKCKAINYEKGQSWKNGHICQLCNETKNSKPDSFVADNDFAYYEPLEPFLIKPPQALFASGSTCKDILSKHENAPSGIYWIRPQGSSSTKFTVYCDMETHGGGWTLVYSYTFTNDQSFTSDNAVTPRPNWLTPHSNVPISTTPPLEESLRGAIDYSIWKDIGKEFMVKLNINDWIVCQKITGGLETKSEGEISCKNIKNVAKKCSGVAPNRIRWFSSGPALFATSYLYEFIVYSGGGDYPDHDPCGRGKPNQKQGVPNPGRAIYLR